MTIVRLGLIVTALACAEPTAVYQRSAATAIVEQPRNSYSIDPVDQTVYLRLTDVRNEDGERAHAFLRRMFQSADSVGAPRLVIDLRSVRGRDARFLVPLIKGIVTRDRFARGAGLYVVVGPRSFSPAQNAATLLRQYANPIFVSSH